MISYPIPMGIRGYPVLYLSGFSGLHGMQQQIFHERTDGTGRAAQVGNSK